MTRLAVIGLGPVGLATSVGFAVGGQDVIGADLDEERVARIARGEAPFYEPDLASTLNGALKTKRLRVTSNTHEAAEEAEIAFLCVGTPSREDGSMDDSYLKEASKSLADAIPANGQSVVVKSTVVPGTTEGVLRPILEASGRPYGLGVNPEFLREGHALEDTLHPSHVVLGADGPGTAARLRALYDGATCPITETDLRTAEAIKYATNAFLATKVAFANEFANLCQALGVSYDKVIQAATLDPRINPRFLVPGVGFGGSCFPKDLSALVSAGMAKGYNPVLLRALLEQNEKQHLQAITLLEEELGDLKGRRIALLGLAFKAGTDDVRDSRAVPIARTLMERGATVVAYDPLANENFARAISGPIRAETLEEALSNADGCILQAGWSEFSQLNAQAFRETMRTPIVVDGRRILDPKRLEGIRFRRIG